MTCAVARARSGRKIASPTKRICRRRNIRLCDSLLLLFLPGFLHPAMCGRDLVLSNPSPDRYRYRHPGITTNNYLTRARKNCTFHLDPNTLEPFCSSQLHCSTRQEPTVVTVVYTVVVVVSIVLIPIDLTASRTTSIHLARYFFLYSNAHSHWCWPLVDACCISVCSSSCSRRPHA